jgi:hypothetical protein
MTHRRTWAARLTTAALGVGLILTPAAAHAVTSTDPANNVCTVTAEENTPGLLVDGVHLQAGAGCKDSPVVSATVWDAPSLTGDPIDVQQREIVAFDDHLTPSQYRSITWATSLDRGCYVQVDVAWGDAPADLTTPYGSRLIAAWHAGDHSCLDTPTPAPSTSAPSSPPATPTPSVPASAAPSLTPTTPPGTTAPPTPTHQPTPKPTKRPAQHHKPKPHRTRPQPAPSASGCIASGCDTTPAPRPHTTTTPAAQLPYTGTPTWLPWAITGGLALIAVGAAILLISAATRLRDNG